MTRSKTKPFVGDTARAIDNVAEDKFRLSRLMDELAEEVRRAQRKHAPMASPHEGYSVLLEWCKDRGCSASADLGRGAEVGRG